MKPIASLVWSVVILGAATLAARAADVSVYAVIKNRSFEQTNATDVTLLTNNPYSFNATVQATTNNVTSATLQPPSLVIIPFSNAPGLGPFGISRLFQTQAAMESNFANGNFEFTINAVHDGTKTPTLSLTGDLYPNAPTVTNYAAAQLIRADTNFTLRWTPFAGGGAGDNIVVTIQNSTGQTVLSTPIYPNAGYLDGTATSLVISNNLLKAGQTYDATMTFAKITLDLFAYGGITLIVPGVTTYTSTTDFGIRTRSVPLLKITEAAASAKQLQFNADNGRSYDIRASIDMTNWSSLLITNASGTNVVYTDAASPGFTFRFYRLQDP